MAPTKPEPGKSKQTNSVLSTVKLGILNAKARIDNLRSRSPHKVVRTDSKTKRSGLSERSGQLLEQLSTIEGQVNEQVDIEPCSLTTPNEPQLPTSSFLTPSDFEIGGTLGRGKFGRVYLTRHISTSYICALKIISKAQCVNEAEERLIRRELEVHGNLAHKNVLKLLSWFHDERNIYLVLEFAPGGSLFSRMSKQPKGRFDESTAARYVAQMAEALRYMHNKKIMHRDIKPENILLGLYDEIKLADFGYSVHSSSSQRSTICGTLDYLSLELANMMLESVASNENYTKAIDQWSLGILMYELLVGKPPFETKSNKGTQKKIANWNGEGIKFPVYVSEEARDLILQLLNMEAEKRLSFDEVLSHPWILGHTKGPEKESQVESCESPNWVSHSVDLDDPDL